MEINSKNLIKIKKITLQNFFAVFGYRIILDLSYIFIISKIWAYNGFILAPNILKIIESYLLLFLIIYLIPKAKNKLSNILIQILILLSFVPITSLYGLMGQPRIYMYAVSVFWLIIFFFQKLPTISIPLLKKEQSKKIYFMISITLIGIVFYLVYKYLGIKINFNLKKVYDVREKYTAADIPLTGYLFNWVSYIILPTLFAISIKQKRKIITVIIIGLQIILFSVTGLKAFLFALPFVGGLMWVIQRKNPIFWLTAGLIAIIILGIFAYWTIDDIWTTSLFTRRVLFTPAKLSFYYHDFFSQHQLIHLSNHRPFNAFLNYPYKLPLPNIIGREYHNNPNNSANNGLYGSAFAHFGYLGIFIWSLLFSTIFKIIDSLAQKVNKQIAIAMIGLPAFFLVNSSLFTSFLTHGLLISLLVLYILPRKYYYEK